jgi:hypothetical protein
MRCGKTLPLVLSQDWRRAGKLISNTLLADTSERRYNDPASLILNQAFLVPRTDAFRQRPAHFPAKCDDFESVAFA